MLTFEPMIFLTDSDIENLHFYTVSTKEIKMNIAELYPQILREETLFCLLNLYTHTYILIQRERERLSLLLVNCANFKIKFLTATSFFSRLLVC